MTSSSDMDDQQAQDPSPQIPTPSPGAPTHRPSLNPAAGDTSDTTPSEPSILPISKEEMIRERMLQNPHRIKWVSSSEPETMNMPRQRFTEKLPPPPGSPNTPTEQQERILKRMLQTQRRIRALADSPSEPAKVPDHPETQKRPESIPSGSLIAPQTQDEVILNHMLQTKQRIEWLPDPKQEATEIPRHPFYHELPPPPSTFSAWILPILLFGLTVFTTLWAGAYHPSLHNRIGAWDFLRTNPHLLFYGIPFAATLLGILVTHEMGHYVLARIHGVPASFPLFIPGPPQFIGTFGAVIRMRSPIMQRKALFDIGVAGPIAGFVAAVIALIIGLSLSEVIPKEKAFNIPLGEPLLWKFSIWAILGPIPSTHVIGHHPIAFAAWFGIFVTAINLLPLGQLDGGHVAFAVFGRQQRQLAYATVPILLYFGFTGWPGWFLWVGMAGIMGLAHPPVADPDVRLGKGRQWVAWGALVIFVITFAPVPFPFA